MSDAPESRADFGRQLGKRPIWRAELLHGINDSELDLANVMLEEHDVARQEQPSARISRGRNWSARYHR